MKILGNPIFPAAVADAEAGSGKRMRNYNEVKYAANHSPDVTDALRQSRKQVTGALSQLSPLRDKLAALDSPTFDKSSVRRIGLAITKLEKQHKTAADDRDKLDTLNQDVQSLKLNWHSQDVSSARKEWGPSGKMHDYNRNPVRVLGAGKDVNAWKDGNLKGGPEGKPLTHQHGEMLDAKVGWADYINQGWMQGGYDSKAAFRLLTPLADKSVKQHNAAVKTNTWNGYENHLRHEGEKMGASKTNPLFKANEDRPTWYAHELADLAKNGYVIHTDEKGRQVAMPKEKAELLDKIKAARTRIG